MINHITKIHNLLSQTSEFIKDLEMKISQQDEEIILLRSKVIELGRRFGLPADQYEVPHA